MASLSMLGGSVGVPGMPGGGDDWFAQFQNPEPSISGPPVQAPAAPMTPGAVTMAEFNQGWMNSPFPGTVEGLKQYYASDPRFAASGITLGGSKGDKVYGPGGAFWGDAVIAAGLGGQGKSQLTGDPGGGPAGRFGSPESIMQQDPGYQFRMGEGIKAIERSAAAKGTLLTGGTLKALNRYGQEYASGEFGNVFDRNLNLAKLGKPGA